MKYLLLFILFTVTACGKEGMPVPFREQEQFRFINTKAILYGSCVLAQATVEGDIDAIEKVYLELETVEDSTKTVFTCPFTPNIAEKASYMVMKNINTTKIITIQYCPKELPQGGYRWRIRGVHYLYRIPALFSPVAFISTKQ